VAIDPLLQANFRQRYDGYLDPLPEENTIADFAEFVPAEARAGNTYNFPLQASLEHGQTADITGLAYALNAARDSEMVNATLDGADLALVANVAYSSMLRGRNGANKGPGGSGGAYWQPFDLKIELMMKSMELYRELALLYGPGTGTSIAGSIGTLDSTPITPGGGANLGVASNGVTARISAASWAPGIWNNMRGALVDIIDAAGTNVKAVDVVVMGVPDASKNQVFLFKSGSSYIPLAGEQLVPKGWAGTTVAAVSGRSCVGLQGILQNTGLLFGINALNYPFWNSLRFTSSGAMSRAKILSVASRMFPNGLTSGLTFFVSSAIFSDLAEEADALQRYTANTDEVKRQGAGTLEYISPAGICKVRLHKYMKQGMWMAFGDGLVKRVGASDVTFRGDNGNDWFFLELPSNAGYQLRAISNQAPVIKIPYQCAICVDAVGTSAAFTQPAN
jgi:hypothetical protein